MPSIMKSVLKNMLMLGGAIIVSCIAIGVITEFKISGFSEWVILFSFGGLPAYVLAFLFSQIIFPSNRSREDQLPSE
ncbi:MAG: hypothetical protein HY617_03225 [Candidatus Sungbacteria bacterium]|nr:hypothetical protein [Candidatus Sungbacteria bacterium]